MNLSKPVHDFGKTRRNLIIGLAAAILAVNYVVLVAPDVESKIHYGNILGPVPAIAALLFAMIVVARQRVSGIFGKAYAALAIGLVWWFAAELLWSYYAIAHGLEAPFPSLADAFWLAGYIPIGYHMFVMARFYGRVRRGLVTAVCAGASILATYYVLSSVGSTTIAGDAAVAAMVISLAYPVLDIALAIPAVLILLGPSRGELTSIPWIFIAWIMTTVGDIMYGHAMTPAFVGQAVIWNLFYNAAYLCMAAGLYWYNRFFIFDKKEFTVAWLKANR